MIEMENLIIVGFLVFVVAIFMTMVGKGGGNFYVIILAIAQIPMHEAATTGQFILFSASFASILIFQKNKSVSWILAIIVGAITALSAFVGGYFSHLFSGFSLKLIFAVMLMTAGIVMLIPLSQKKVITNNNSFGIIKIKSSGEMYHVNIWITFPIIILTGFGSGMVGVSGGSFLVPLMVLACGVSMNIAVGTASVLIAATAFMGFTGHIVQGDFNPSWAIPLAVITIIGGIVGGMFAIKTEPMHLKKLFAYTNCFAALFMIINALNSKGII